jgi:hypothetical protein
MEKSTELTKTELKFVGDFFKEYFVDEISFSYPKIDDWKKNDTQFPVCKTFRVEQDFINRFHKDKKIIEWLKEKGADSNAPKELMSYLNPAGVFIYDPNLLESLFNKEHIGDGHEPVVLIVGGLDKHEEERVIVHEQMHNFQYCFCRHSLEEKGRSEGIAVAGELLFVIGSSPFNQLKNEFDKRYSREYLAYQLLAFEPHKLYERICDALEILLNVEILGMDPKQGLTLPFKPPMTQIKDVGKEIKEKGIPAPFERIIGKIANLSESSEEHKGEISIKTVRLKTKEHVEPKLRIRNIHLR